MNNVEYVDVVFQSLGIGLIITVALRIFYWVNVGPDFPVTAFRWAYIGIMAFVMYLALLKDNAWNDPFETAHSIKLITTLISIILWNETVEFGKKLYEKRSTKRTHA